MKPAKPYIGFPLFAHASGRWAKKIRGKFHFFGRWATVQNGSLTPVTDTHATAAESLIRFQKEWPYLSEGRTPPSINVEDACDLRTLCNAFLTTKRNRVAAGELSERAFMDYRKITDLLINFFKRERRVDDLRPDDFERLRNHMASRWGPVRLKNEITRVRMVFKFGFDQRLIPQPVNYGQSFDRPSAKTIRKSRNAAGPKLFERDEIHLILTALDGKPVTVDGAERTLPSDPVMKAMTLLGLNCGFGNTDVASLPRAAVDLESGWIAFPRPKTEIDRRIPLWPETTRSIKAAFPLRPGAASPADDKLCFLTRCGKPWVRMQATTGTDDMSLGAVSLDPLGQRFRKLVAELGLRRRPGLGFYTLRHVFETEAGESRDQVAVNAIMGHVDDSMAGMYRERISDDRLKAVVNKVRKWIFEPSRLSTTNCPKNVKHLAAP